MRAKIKKTVTIIAILSLLPIFLGQDDCELTNTFKKEVVNKIKESSYKAKSIQLNVSFYPLVNTNSDGETEIMGNINYLIASVLQDFVSEYNKHEIEFQIKSKKNTWKTSLQFLLNESQEDTKKIIGILSDAQLARDDKIKKIISALMSGSSSSPDILMTGRCYDNLTGDNIIVEIMALYKGNRTIEIRKIELQKAELLKTATRFRASRLLAKDEIARKLLKKKEDDWDMWEEVSLLEIFTTVYGFFTHAYEREKKDAHPPLEDVLVESKSQPESKDTEPDEFQIEEKVRKMIEELSKPGKPLSPEPIKQKIYVSNLSFMDAQTLSTMVQTEVMQLIDEAVVKGMAMGKKANDDLVINAPGHTIPNTDANVNQLVTIVFDPNLTKKEKDDRVISNMMLPNNVDVIVTGHYIDNARNPLIDVRPLVIVKSQKKTITKNLQFKPAELV